MKLLTRRAAALLILAGLLVLGLVVFSFEYVHNAGKWAQYPTNKHYYENGKLMAQGTIYDRNGEILRQFIDGQVTYHQSKTVRTALMQTIGDSYGNIGTSIEVAFADKLAGWDFVNGAYRFDQTKSSSNQNITLTLDSKLCAVAYEALNGRKGTVGVYNYKTGEILCMVSSPSFDPQNRPDIEGNPQRYEGVYINRLFSATYPPGSIFKLVTAAAAIDNMKDIQTRTFHCEGEETIQGDVVTCLSAHGDLDFSGALAKSCNVAFGEIAMELGANTIERYAEKAELTESLSVDGIRTAQGNIDLSQAEGANLAWAGIGQYKDMVNPLSFLAYVGAIGNNGVMVTPRILETGTVEALLPGGGIKKTRVLKEETAKTLAEMMRNDVVSEYGVNNYANLELRAKSGTAEVGGDETPHAWFTGFMDREDYPLAFIVIVENGGAGSKVAGAVAAKVLKAAVTE